jgi:hypothetical protein
LKAVGPPSNEHDVFKPRPEGNEEPGKAFKLIHSAHHVRRGLVRTVFGYGNRVILQLRQHAVSELKTFSLPKRKQKPKPDPYYPAAVANAKEAARRLQDAGIIDAEGNRIRKDLPPDMKEGQDRDFGG